MKYFLFYGCDLSSPKENLDYVTKLGNCLIPLDPNAIGYVLEYGFEYKLIDDIISQEELVSIRDKAESISENWFESVRSEFTINGICWPEFDQMAMYWSWNDRLIILKLISKLDHPDATFSIVELKGKNLRPAVFAYPTAATTVVDGIKLLISDVAKNKLVIHSFAKKSPLLLALAKKFAKRFRRKFSSFFYKQHQQNRQSTKGLEIEAIRNKIVFIDLEDDFYRAKHLIGQINSQFPDQLILCPIVLFNNRSLSDWQQIREKMDTNVVSLPTDFKINQALGTRLYQAFEHAIQNMDDDVTREAFRNLSFQFQYYCYERWPLLDAYHTYLSDTFKIHKPSAVIVSNLDSAETQLPALAADRLGISTFAVPHGGVGRCKLNLQSARTIFYGSELMMKISTKNTAFANNIILKKRLTITPGMITERNNVVSPIEVKYDKTKLKVLVLTSTIGINELILPFVLPRAQISILSAISETPKHLQQAFQILIRPRPGNLDLKMYKNLGLGNMLIPSETELEENIANADVVVALNNYQTSLSHAIRYQKPIILLTNDKSLLQWKMMSYSEKYTELGNCISSVEELWTTLDNIQKNKTLLETMTQRTTEFHKHYWETSHYPTITDVMLQELEPGLFRSKPLGSVAR